MNEYGPPPDWESVFHRARRRMFGRLLLVAVFAALGGGLLLNGGLAAQGSAPWLPINRETEKKQDNGQHHGNTHERRRQHKQQGDDGNGHPGHKSDQDRKGHEKGDRKTGKSHNQWAPCPGDSAGTQYCDAPPPTPSGGPTGKTDTSTGEVAEMGEVASTGEIAPVPED